MNCIFQKYDDNLVCSNCGFSIPFKEYKFGVYRTCTSKGGKIKNFTKEVGKQAKSIIQGKEIKAKDETVEKRLEICKECDHYKDGKCTLCGCILAFKTRLEQSNCPIGKW